MAAFDSLLSPINLVRLALMVLIMGVAVLSSYIDHNSARAVSVSPKASSPASQAYDLD